MSRPRRRRESDDGWGGQGMRGYMAAKKRKLDEQFETDASNQVQKEGTCSSIFNGVAIYVNGWTEPPADELRRLMQVHGGKYDVYPSRSHTTHVIASNLPDRKIKDIKDKKVVRPQWITESIKAGYLLSHVPYMLYRRDHAQGALNFRSLTRTSTTLINDDEASMEDVSDGDTDSVRSNDSVIPSDDVRPYDGVRPMDGVIPSVDVRPSDGMRPSDDVRPTDGLRPTDGVRPYDVRPTDGVRPLTGPHGNSFDGNNSLSTSSNNNVSFSYNKSSFKGNENNDSSSFQGDDTQDANSYHDNSVHGDSLSSSTVQQQPLSKLVHTSPSGKKPMGSSKDANFVAEFYDNSRLHHLSTWRTDFQAYVNVLQGKGDNGFPGRQRLRDHLQSRPEPATDDNSDRMSFHETDRFTKVQVGSKVVMHLDMDCFFVSVGLRNHPNLRGKPVAVTHSKGKGHEQKIRPGMDPEYERAYWEKRAPHRHSITDKTEDNATRGNAQRDTYMSFSEIASCSYEARKAGVKNGMFMGPALKLCPDLKTIPYDFEGYKEVAQEMYGILASYTHEIEAVSCDEAFVDVTDILADTGATPDDLATVLRKEILEKTQCPASVGLASSVLLARMATKRAKPNGQFYLPPEEVLDFVSPQTVRELPGVGRSLESRLKVMGVVTCGDLQKVTLPTLQREFGPKTGQALYRSCRGQDDRQLKVERERKSVSAEINYGIRFTKDTEAETFMYNLAEEVQRRLQKAGLKGKTVTLKVMARKADAPVEPSKFMGHGICDSLSKSSTLGLATDDHKVIGKEAWNILCQMKLLPSDNRGLGIQITRLVSASGASSSSASNKSIMDFVKAKPATAIQSTSTNNIPLSSANIPDSETESGGSISNKKTMLHFLKPSTSTTTEEMQELEEDTLLDDAVSETHESTTNKTPKRAGLPPLPTLPTFKTPKGGVPVQGRINEGASSSHEDLYLPSPSQVDPSVLAALPKDIRQQIEQTYAARNIPLRLNPKTDVRGYDTEEDTEAGETEKAIGIDQSFLDALPEDLRKEIEEEQLQKVASETTMSHRTSRGKGPSKPGIHQLHGDASAAVCTNVDRGHSSLVNRHETHSMEQSTEPVAGPSEEGRMKKRSDSGPIVALPDLNKIDPTCLDALPPELQQELKRAYAQQQKQQQPPPQQQQQQRPNQPQDALKLLGQSKGRPSPPKAKRKYTRRKPLNNSPSKRRAPAATTSPAKKRLSPQKLIWNQARDNVVTTSTKEPAETSVAPVPEPAPVEAAVSTCDTTAQVHQVNLCGRVELPEVKELLKEWTHTCPVPEEEDVEQFVQYLHQLILDRNLETVDLLIKYIRRLCNALDTSTWRSAVEEIINSIQEVMEQLYGSKLKVT
ncbi:DNA repair protein REV1-like [Branchiostoma floridae]|uniref:DNA repair protein REV1 n=1 Tax=Branchiostoma floridae TaxID=7739 RepID=A0A9J7KZ52_BRAFL|nr:DNA repair protein REV1-like [Branchiostoma floridae]